MGTFIITLIAVLLVSDVFWWWYARSRFPLATPSHRRRRLFITFIASITILSLFLIVLSRLTNSRLDDYTPRILIIFTMIWHLMAVPVAWMIVLLHGTTRLGAALFGRTSNMEGHTNASNPGHGGVTEGDRSKSSRREFLGQLGAITPLALAGVSSAYSAVSLSDLRVRAIELPIRSLPSALDGLVIAHVSDTHLGRFTDASSFGSIVNAVNELDADLVLHTGDLINDDQSFLPLACDLIRQMRARHGTFLCEGNHDLIGGRENFETFMRKAKMPILINQLSGLTINGQAVEFLGLPWARGGRTNGADRAIADGVASLSKRRSAGAFPILLAHHPHAFDSAIEHQIPLTLSGHTHGGQINLSPHIGFGPAMYRYWSGLYSEGDSHTVVSNGAGNWFPLRINAPAEIARIVLRRE